MCEVDYYLDENYQLELNLHNIRKELIAMLEYYEKSLCTVCLHLKCTCVKGKSTTDIIIVNGNTSDEKKETDKDTKDKENKKNQDEELENVDKNVSVAPPASSLPKPKWDSSKNNASTSSSPEKEPVHPDIEAWMEASKAEPKSIKEPIILQNLCYINKQKKCQIITTNRNVVDSYFKYFKVSNETAVTYMSAKLAAACSTPIRKNYTYF
ncbi:unnamed protein product, partial [Brenthis ino]